MGRAATVASRQRAEAAWALSSDLCTITHDGEVIDHSHGLGEFRLSELTILRVGRLRVAEREALRGHDATDATPEAGEASLVGCAVRCRSYRLRRPFAADVRSLCRQRPKRVEWSQNCIR